jgi:hypothetical protein
MKTLVLGLAGLSFVMASNLWAGTASLTNDEMTRLQKLALSSPDAARWARSIERSAQTALAETPHPIPHIQTAGKLQGSAEKTQTQEALKDMSRLKSLEWAYAMTGREDFRQKAEAYVAAWAKTCQPPENPIDATNLEVLLETYDLIRPKASPADQALINPWVAEVTQTLWASDDPSRGTHTNNWQAHRLKIIALAAFDLDDQAMEKWVLGSFQELLNRNLNPDGTTLDFLERDALHYHVYDLEPMIRLAMLYERAGMIDLYHWKNEKGASIAQCVSFLLSFATAEKTHAEYVHTTVKFDIQRANNHEKGHGIGENFEPKAAEKCLELAQFFDPSFKTLVGTLAGEATTNYPTLQILINEVTRPIPTPTTQP